MLETHHRKNALRDSGKIQFKFNRNVREKSKQAYEQFIAGGVDYQIVSRRNVGHAQGPLQSDSYVVLIEEVTTAASQIEKFVDAYDDIRIPLLEQKLTGTTLDPWQDALLESLNSKLGGLLDFQTSNEHRDAVKRADLLLKLAKAIDRK
ncbi:MAG: hypothetical protein HYW49_03565 [Deltaproteobacteria bacterium]|nr:hypothetical protein [Deltaproteobacteria bacterium]